MMDSNPHLCGD